MEFKEIQKPNSAENPEPQETKLPNQTLDNHPGTVHTESGEENLVVRSSRDGERQIAYTTNFRNFIKEHPGVVSDTLWCIQDIERRGSKPGTWSSAVGILVTLENPKGSSERKWKSKGSLSSNENRFYKFEYDNRTLFIKQVKMRNDTTGVGGVEEIQNSYNAVQLLRKANIPGVRIIDYQLGFTDKQYDYFVSDYLSPKGFIRLDQLEVQNPEAYQALKPRCEQIVAVLEPEGYNDIGRFNTFYDSKTDTLILFDLSKNKATS